MSGGAGSGGLFGIGAVPPRGPVSPHRDASWYRAAATKESADSDQRPAAMVSDDAAWAAMSHTIAGILLYGGAGWLVGHWLGHQEYFVAGGVLIGVALALFMLFRRLEASGTEHDTSIDRADRSAHGGTPDGLPAIPVRHEGGAP